MSDDFSKKRLEICDTCDKQVIKFTTKICGQCGCILAVKAALKTFKCPLDKWDKEDKNNG